MYCQYVSAQDWVITGTEIVENDTLVVNGNLIVKAGGSLTLRNVYLRLNIHHDAEYSIKTEPGSSLFIFDSDIGPTDSAYTYQFSVNGSKFIFKHNTLRGAGFPLDYGGWENLGLAVFRSDSAIIVDNTIYHTTGSGISLDWCRYATVSGNIVTNKKRGTFGIALTKSEECLVSNNMLSNLSESIFLQQNTYGCEISNNTVTNSILCIVLRHGVGYNTVINNKVSTSWRGIWLSQAPFPNKLQSNEISKMTNEGICVEYATGSIIANNTISEMVSSGINKMGGIFLYRSNDSHVLNNTVNSSPDGGITLFSSSLSRIEGNQILNSKYGIGLWYDSDNNIVSSNSLVDNKRNIIVDLSKENIINYNHCEGGSPNGYDNSNSFWNGNYWSDFKGWDEGLVNSTAPYLISSNGIDLNPLIRPPGIQNASVPNLDIPKVFPSLEDKPHRDPITVPTVWENQTIEFSWGWKLYILSGASLTMNNVTLLGASPSTAEPEIIVKSGAQLYINNSSIIGGELDYPLAIIVDQGGVCEIKNSLLKNLNGITINGNGSILENNRFEKCLWTIDVWGIGNRIVNNVLDRCYFSINADLNQNTVLGNDEKETIVNFNKNEPSIFSNIVKTLESDTAKVSIACNNGTSLELKFKAGNVSEKQMSVTWFDKLIPTYYNKLKRPSSFLGFFHLASNIQTGFSAEMTFHYTDSSLIKNAIVNETSLSFAYYDTVKGHWVKVTTYVDSAKNILLANINHFSLWGILIPEDSLFVDVYESNQYETIPNSLKLFQNYPNPFNPVTSISFSLPTRSFVSLKVFDLIGRDVATIISEELSAGDHSRQWNAANMTSGVYFYRLQAGNYSNTKKLVLLK